MVQESYTVEEEPQELAPVVSVETSEDGTTRRTETTVTKVLFNICRMYHKTVRESHFAYICNVMARFLHDTNGTSKH